MAEVTLEDLRQISCSEVQPLIASLAEKVALCTLEEEACSEGEPVSQMTMLIATLVVSIFFGVTVVVFRKELLSAKAKGVPAVRVGEFMSYRIDYLFSTYTWSKPAVLLWLTLFLIFCGGLLLSLSSILIDFNTEMTFFKALWLSWTFIADPGSHADQEDTGSRFVALFLTICGMLVFALVISIVAEGISSYVDGMKKGHSCVFESGHTLVIGWGDKLVPILNQIAIANESEGGDNIVVLTHQDKEESEEFLREKTVQKELLLRGSTLICRSGSPLLIPDLMRVSAHEARSVVVLSANSVAADETDGYAVRVVLCLKGMKIKGYAVVEVKDIDNEELLKMVAPEIAETIVSHDMIGRVMLQCSRQPGLAMVLEDLMGFEGDEFYLEEWDKLEGKTFYEAHFSFPDALPIGIHRANAKVGIHEINPDDNSIFNKGDKLLVIAEDNDTYEYEVPSPKLLRSSTPPTWTKPVPKPEHVLFCGWRRDIDDIVVELDSYVAKGSSLTIMSQMSKIDREKSLIEGGLDVSTLKNLTLHAVVGNLVSRRDLSQLPLEKYSSVLVFSEENLELQMTISDSRSLTCLLIMKDIQKRRCTEDSYCALAKLRCGSKQMILTEMLDVSTRTLVAMTGVSDYVLSNELVSMAMAQVAEDREINGVLKELLSEVDNEIYIKAIDNYAKPGSQACFYDIMKVARMRKEVAVGYIGVGEGQDRTIYINPRGKDEIKSWPAGVSVIIIAED